MAAGLGLLARPLVMAWVGPRFESSVPVIYVLALVVAIRVGNATATTMLKGMGDHRLLAASNLVMSLANLGLSVALAPKYGLIGVALGTLIPVGLVSILWIFPLACRRVGLPLTGVIRAGVWPAMWPVLVMCGFLLISRSVLGAGLVLVAAQAIVAAALYCLVFLLMAVSNKDREWYLGNLMMLFRRQELAEATS